MVPLNNVGREEFMDYRYLKAFLMTARHQSFTKASAQLRVAQSAVGRQIKLLEEELKVDLFVRSSKQVYLTEMGKKLYSLCCEFEGQLEQLLQQQSIKTIRIGILQGVLDYWFRPLLKTYYEKHHHNLEMFVSNVTDLKMHLSQGSCDLAFLTENIQSETLTSMKLFQEKYVLLGPSQLKKEELHLHRWIIYSDDDPLFYYAKKRSPHILKVNSMSIMISLVEEGVGVAMIPSHIHENYLAQQLQQKKHNYAVQDVSFKDKSFIYLVMPNLQFFPPHLKELLSLIQQHVGQTK
jgi:DNA-binding transcriptional LysR family regulator